ncbi:MAG: glycosyltransferase [Microbacterium sp.]
MFDAEFYLAQADKAGLSEQEAALHYVSYGCAAQLNPHPLIECEYLPPTVRERLVLGDVEAFLDHLRSDDGASRAWGPLFDPRSTVIEDGLDAVDHLRSLRPEDLLPVPASFAGPVPRYEQARDQAIAHATWLLTQRGREVRTTRRWGVDADRAFRAEARNITTGALVSVVMPTWNRADTVVAAIESVIGQTYQNWELIVVDDGSTDETVEIVRGIAAGDARIRLIPQAHAGVSAVRNAALSHARGDVIAFLDADNAWRPDFLGLSMGALEGDAELVAVFTGMRIHGEGKDDLFRGGDVSNMDLRFGNSIDMNVFVARKSAVDVVGGFDQTLKRWVDYDLVLRLSELGPFRYLPFIGCDYLDDTRPDRITRRESANWVFVVMAKHAMDWDAASRGLSERTPGRVSVVTIAYEDHLRTTKAVDRVLSTTEGQDVEVVIVDNGSRHAVGRVLSARFAQHPRVRYHRLARNLNFATGSNVGFAHATGEYIMFLNNDTAVKEGWLDPLVERLETTGAFAVQPLLLYPNGNIQTAGTIFNSRNGLATHFLAEHPAQDAARHSGKGFTAITAGAMLIRAEDFVRVKGFDPIFANGLEDVDLCLRAGLEFGATFEVEHRSRVVHEESKSPGRFDRETVNQHIFRERWASRLPEPQGHQYLELGFSWTHMRSSLFPRPILSRPERTALVAGRGEVPSYRWAIKLGANGMQDRWGDVPFADDLAKALTDLGQEVVITRHGGHHQSSAYLDDILLTIRGAEPVQPQAGRVNILWVISRAERVTVDEVRGYDAVFAASPRWAQWMSEQSGRPIDVMLQATAPDRFNLDVAPAAQREDVLFVGGPRITEGGRPIVQAALDSGAQVGLWGGRWDEVVAPELFRGSFLPFADVASHYRAANIVLNDHMESMREWSFINNRLFDVVASGVPVVSDDVEGLELFGGVARAAESPQDVVDALRDRSWVPTSETIAAVSERIRAEHSFARRAEVFLDRALSLAPDLIVRP